jgi:phage baseplate assembly protein W
MANYTTFIKGGHTDSQATNESTRSAKIYKDLNLFFQKNSSDKDINKVTDVQAVKRSIRNLVLTNHYERPFHPEIGSNILGTLFEPMTPSSSILLTKQIEEVIQNFEPRARLTGVRALEDLDRNAYNCTVEFYVVNAPTELETLDLMLERIR